jgi:hypothetical protein
MCTVTYIPTESGAIITSNRDEKTQRERAIPPIEYQIANTKIRFPKDPKGGGSWIATTASKIVVLLNGATANHIKNANYRKSRGLVLTELAISENTISFWENVDLVAIEPFTIICFENSKLVQFQWDASQKYFLEKDSSQPHIWSSATLYSPEIRNKRRDWFTEFLAKKEQASPEDILHFHLFTEKENKDFGLQINRNEELKTMSVTQCIYKNNNIDMNYFDLLDGSYEIA